MFLYGGLKCLSAYIQYSTNYKGGDPNIAQKVNYVGNSVKSMTLSVDASLDKLRTHYIDIFYVYVLRLLRLTAAHDECTGIGGTTRPPSRR